MPEYRRILIPGGAYFFTLVTYQRKNIFSSSLARSMFINAVNHVCSYHPFTIVAYCLLPDHIHVIWQLPEDDCDYSRRISAIKRRFSINYRQNFNSSPTKNMSKIKRRELTIWQRRFWEHFIRNEEDLEYHLNYLHFNPVKHGLVDQVRDWEASSFRDYVKLGYYDLDWGGNYQNEKQNHYFGE